MSEEKSLSTTSLEALQSQDMRTVMDVVDQLRRAGLGTIVQLPQIVTCGDQSSGKSSVLEAITGIPFPRKENLCTRFATEIILRRAKNESVAVKINPDKIRPIDEQQKFQAYKKTITDFDELPDLMDEVSDLMGLGQTEGPLRAFYRDVLSIEISGPDRPQLTLVDLPGLIHSENKQQTKDDVETVKALVEDYVQEKRTIVLAVVSAKNDYANQIILKKARDFDATDRTLGIITKPDFLTAGSENERSWIELAQNKDIFFGLGWHILKNSQLLYQHLKRELPELQKELSAKHKETTAALKQLGKSRATAKEQRRYLMQLGSDFERVAQSAVDGHYENRFFGAVDASQPLDHPVNLVRLRALVQHSNIQFAKMMRLYGAKYRVTDRPTELQDLKDDDNDDVELDPAYAQAADQQVSQTYDGALEWVSDVLQRSRGRELPGNFNPMLISQLFWDQSEPWEDLASAHVDRVSGYCKAFIQALIKNIATSEVSERLNQFMVEPAFERRCKAAREELEKILEDEKRHPITYNHYYTTTIQKIRNKRNERNVRDMLRNIPRYSPTGLGQVVKENDMNKAIENLNNALVQADMDEFAAGDALISQMAYYKDELKYFVNAVTKQVIERCLIANLANDIISSFEFGEMNDQQLAALAGEPHNVVQERDRLKAKKDTLEAGQKAFKDALGGF